MKGEEWLDKVPKYKQGELSPAEAHIVSQLLEEDEKFRMEAAREELLWEVLSEPPSKPMPRNLINRSVKAAVGEINTGKWFSLDTILIALGVGLICAAAAQLLTPKLPSISESGGFFTAITSLVASNSMDLIGGIWLITVVFFIAGVWLAFRTLRN